jgi:hypothetical protein
MYAFQIHNKTQWLHRGADKFLARSGRKQTTATEDFEVHLSYLQSQLEEYYYYLHIYNKTSIKRNILTIKQNTSGSGLG